MWLGTNHVIIARVIIWLAQSQVQQRTPGVNKWKANDVIFWLVYIINHMLPVFITVSETLTASGERF
jgi:hypothetical protein